MSLIAPGEHVWLDDKSGREEFSVPIGARVESIEGSKVVLKDDEGRVSGTDFLSSFQTRITEHTD
jgi:DNA/RNA-binding domain of Phe-tRNA-synthetase-like protein